MPADVVVEPVTASVLESEEDVPLDESDEEESLPVPLVPVVEPVELVLLVVPDEDEAEELLLEEELSASG